MTSTTCGCSFSPLLDDPGLVRERSAGSRERVRLNYAWDAVVDTLEQLYTQCLASSRVSLSVVRVTLITMRLLIGNKYWYPKGGGGDLPRRADRGATGARI